MVVLNQSQMNLTFSYFFILPSRDDGDLTFEAFIEKINDDFTAAEASLMEKYTTLTCAKCLTARFSV